MYITHQNEQMFRFDKPLLSTNYLKQEGGVKLTEHICPLFPTSSPPGQQYFKVWKLQKANSLMIIKH